jgi:hypothetical protein
MSNFAPVIVPTLNRFEHFKNCIESLSACIHADKTDLFIALDYPFKESHFDGYQKIKNYIGDISGFKSVNIIRRDENFGVNKNMSDAMSDIFEHYDTMIISEDDNVFAPDFIRFVNLGLEVYKDREDIFSINGYTDPIDIPETYQKDVYIWAGFAAWGCGIWKEKWDKIDFSEDVLLKNVQCFLYHLDDVFKLNQIANHYIPALLLMLKQNCVHGDGYICLYQFVNNMYSIFPTISRVRNMGNDGSGINCGIMENDIYKEQEIYAGSGSYELPFDIKPDKEINYILRAHWKTSYKSQLRLAAKLLLMKARLYNP